MAHQNGYVFEHRLVLARFLNRPLLRRETVHHLNGDSLDNRLENLELAASQSDHIRRCHNGSLRRHKRGLCWCGDPHLAKGLCDRHYKMAERFWKSIGRTMDSFQY
jgi:hypothetical protein